jgi:hypothetical protein
MNRYVIERTLPGAGLLSPNELRALSAKSNEVLAGLQDVSWVHSYVTDDKLYCVYIAPDEAIIRKHAQMGGFPANNIAQVRSTIDPATAE